MRKLVVGVLITILFVRCLGGCAKKTDSIKNKESKEFSAFFAYYGKEISSNNRVMNAIATKVGAKVEMKWLEKKSAEEEIKVMIANNTYPDFIDGYTCTKQLVEAGALIPLEGYLDQYPNIKAFLSEEEWEKLKDENGHIYYIPQFNSIQGEEVEARHYGEAFWIQKEVLRWAGYPKITTIDEYFNLIERYKEAFPVINGEETIGFQILCDEKRSFCLENPPQFLAGYPNDGCAIVDTETLTCQLYDFIPESESYYRKLNEMYNKGILKATTFFMSYQEYIELLSTGRVLGMVDQYWQFMEANDNLYRKNMVERTYVPLGLTVEEGVQEHYRNVEALNVSRGIGITVSCDDVEGALQFMDDLLDPEIMTLRYWGEEGKDYYINEEGIFYMSEVQRKNIVDENYIKENLCDYNYFPHYEGLLADGKNSVYPSVQDGEYYAMLCEYDKMILDAYGYSRWTDFLNDPVKENSPWFPLYAFSDNLDSASDAGNAKNKMKQIKLEWLPRVIMSSPEEFEEQWKNYKEYFYNHVDVEAYINALNDAVAKSVNNDLSKLYNNEKILTNDH